MSRRFPSAKWHFGQIREPLLRSPGAGPHFAGEPLRGVAGTLAEIKQQSGFPFIARGRRYEIRVFSEPSS